MSRLREIRGVLLQNLRCSIARPRHVMLAAVGLIVASATLVALLTIPYGLARLAARTGLESVAIVLPGKAPSSIGSAGKLALIGNLPGVAHTRSGHALVAPQFVVQLKLRRRDGSHADVVVRGINEMTWRVLGNAVRISRGRLFRPGVHELVAGVGALQDFATARLGNSVLIRHAPWRVTGELTARGSLWESELWTDLSGLQSAWNAGGRFSTFWVKLTSPDAFQTFQAALESNRSLRGMTAIPQKEYYSLRIGFLYRFVAAAVWLIALVLGAGATLAIANALNLAVSARRTQNALLRALGFRRSSLAVGMLVEIMALALICAGMVIAAGWLMLNGVDVSSTTFSRSIHFVLHLGWRVALWATLYSLILGAVAAIWPITHTLRFSVVRSLQEG
ncbi:MAG TPA: FtsX-like permease family protein [Gammaproteobacteria bacterium]|nr:FtsX-like permease family protein [Gammaproteobacteria bacterium]